MARKPRSVSTASLPTVNIWQEENEHKNYVTVEKIVAYITKVFGKDSKSKGFNMSMEYAFNRNKIVSTLWKIILRSLNFSSDVELYEKKLDQPVNEFEAALFQILERLKMLLDQICYPGFPNMNELFFLLGFRCLSRYQFMEYMNACVFEVNTNLVQRVVKELLDTFDNIGLKHQLISKLSKENAYGILKEWNNASSNRYLSQQLTAKLPSQIIHHNMNLSEMAENGEDFVPLRTLLESIKLCSHKSGSVSRSIINMDERSFQLIASSALAETNSLITTKHV